jgi:hypothetical protein
MPGRDNFHPGSAARRFDQHRSNPPAATGRDTSMNRVHQPNYGGVNFPAFAFPLDRPRAFQFSAQAAKRFHTLRGFDATDLPAKMEGMGFERVKEVFADLIWCGLSDNDRREISIEDARRLMSLSAMIGGLNKLLKAVGPSNAQN